MIGSLSLMTQTLHVDLVLLCLLLLSNVLRVKLSLYCVQWIACSRTCLLMMITASLLMLLYALLTN